MERIKKNDIPMKRSSSKAQSLIGALCFGAVIILIAVVQHDVGFDERPVVNHQLLMLNAKIEESFSGKDEDEEIKNIFDMNQDDPRLINKIKKEFLYPPSLEPYNLTTKYGEDPSVWQAQFVKEILRHKKKGFFVDAGAHEGDWISNTLAFERHDGWEGILVEAVPDNFRVLQSKHRKAYTVPACLSNTKYPKTLEFQKLGPRSRLTSMFTETKQAVVVQCFTLYSILLAVGRTKIDYFSLDVEGLELEVLETIPWDKVEISVISVEYENMNKKKRELRHFMKRNGYSWVDYPPTAVLGIDYLFYRNDLLPK